MNDTPDWVNRLSQCTGGHHESTLAVAEGLVIEMPDVLGRLKAAIAAEDPREVQRLGHTLKSSIRYLADGSDLVMAASVEQHGKVSQFADAQAAIPALEAIVTRWVREVESWLDQQP